jgi:RNA polymerase sigma-70 factor (ECF subfamily)
VGELSDAELVRLVAGGGDAARPAETELCARFAPRIRLYGLRHLRDEDRARDLVQTVLLAVLEAVRADRVAEPEHLARFVLGVCRNTSLRAHELAARTVGDEPLSSFAVEPTERIDMAALFRCLDRLEERAQMLVRMSFLEDRPAEAIAAVLSTTAGNVRVMRHRALLALRGCLEARS